MSELQALCQRLESVNRDADELASDLAQRAQRLSQAASQAASVGSGSARAEGAHAAQALQAASRSAQQAAQLLHQVSVAGRGFVSRHATGGAGGGVPVSSTVGSDAVGTVSGRSDASLLAPFWSSHGGEYVPPSDADWSSVPTALAAHSDPHGFASWVNDGGNGQPGRGVNCADCARSVESSWRGEPQVSAARAPGLGGESFGRIEEWLGAPLEPSSFSGIERGLADAGHGSSAYVVVTWKGGGGHAFNAVNHQGTVFFIDAQPTGGAVDTWPPKRSSPGYGFDETDVNEVFVNYRGA